MRNITKSCAQCGVAFSASCGAEKFCSDRCKFHSSYTVLPNGCHEWNNAKDKDGYGYIKEKGTRRTRKAHRFSYELENGPIPENAMVCHSCDNPPCVNKDHLFLGGAQTNKDDSVVKARHVHGRGVYWTNKLTEHQVLAIRADVRPRRTVASDYGVTAENIDAIRKGKTWKHI